MTYKKSFYNRLKYAPFKFDCQDGEVPAYKHINPDGSEGGWVAETALVEDTCYVGPNAQVFEYASVTGTVQLLEDSRVCEFAQLTDNVIVDDFSMVCGNAKLSGNAYIGGNSIIAGDTKVGGYREIFSEIKE